MKKIYFSFLILTSLSFYNCSKDKGPVDDSQSTGNVSFTNDVQPVFDQYCTSCHPSSGNLDLTAANSYNQLVNVDASAYSAKRVIAGDPEQSVLYKKIDNSGTYGSNMPLGSSLSASQINMIKQWIEEGAKNN